MRRSSRSPLTRIRLRLVPALLVAALGGSLAAAPAAVAAPPAGRSAAAIEDFAAYQPQFFCRSTVEPGVRAFEKLTLAAYPNTTSDGDMRACSDGGTSEHKEGRAWDWAVDHRVASQRRAGEAMLAWLFATDSHGNADAEFRRLGLMYVIWNKQIWGSWDRRWEPYSCSGVTACHVDHVHFSFGWAGAEGRTSYWTGTVSGTVEPPLPEFTRRDRIRTLAVDSAAGSTYGLWLLHGGARYRVTGTGKVATGSADTDRADTACTRTEAGWRPSSGTVGTVTVGGDRFSSWGERWVPTHDNGYGCNPIDHTYRLVLAPAQTSTVQAAFPDGRRSDDHGTLTLSFRRVD